MALSAFAFVAAAPAGSAAAQNVVGTQHYLIGTGPVANATAVAQPGTAGDTADYTIGFTTPSALLGGSATITLQSPDNSTTFPPAATDYLIIDNSSPAGDQAVGTARLGAGGHSVTLGVSRSLSAGTSLSVYVIGATNPAKAGSYSLDVLTSANTLPASTTDFQVSAPASPPAFEPTAVPPLAGGLSTYTIGAFKAASALAAGDKLTVASSAGAGVTDNVAFPASGSAYKLTDLTTHTSGAPRSVSISGAGKAGTGSTVTVQVAGAIAAGDELSLTVSGVRNPSTTQRDTITAAAPSTAGAASASVQIGTSITNPTISISETGAEATGVEYTIGFKLLSGLGAGGSVVLVAPAGTSFAKASVTLVDVTHVTASANIPTASAKPAVAGSSSTDNELSFTLPKAVDAGDSVFVEVAGVANPPAGNYGGPAGDFTVATSADVIPASAPAYVVTAAPTPLLASVEVSATTPGSVAQYTIGDLKASAVLAGGKATLILRAPSGTTMPSATGDYTVADLTRTTATAHPAGVAGGGTASVALTLSTTVAAGDYIDIVADGVVNPPPGYYSISVVGDVVAAVAPTSPPPPPPPPPVQPTSVFISPSANPVGLGEPVTYSVTVRPAPGGGTVLLTDNGAPVAGCGGALTRGTTTCSVTYWRGGRHVLQAFYSGASGFRRSTSGLYGEVVALPATGYWLATKSGAVFGARAARALGGIPVSAATGPLVGIAGTPTGKGYWLVTARGDVAAFGDAKFYGDLPGFHVRAADVVAIAPTFDGHGYWLVGRDGGMFAFGNARFHGSVPGLRLRVHDIVGMVASPDGGGYLVVGSDGGVFSFGSAHFYGSVPGLGKHVHDVRAILPASNGHGYVLVGADGGAFVFGTGVHFLGSLPGRGIRAHDVVGLALSPDNGGYFMAASNGAVFGFGDAAPGPMPAGLASQLPVVAIAGT